MTINLLSLLHREQHFTTIFAFLINLSMVRIHLHLLPKQRKRPKEEHSPSRFAGKENCSRWVHSKPNFYRNAQLCMSLLSKRSNRLIVILVQRCRKQWAQENVILIYFSAVEVSRYLHILLPTSTTRLSSIPLLQIQSTRVMINQSRDSQC